MAADGSVIIEIEGNASEIISEFQRVTSAAENIESSVQQIADAFREAASAAEGLDGSELENAANSAEGLDQDLDQAAQAAGRLEDALDGNISGELDEAARSADDLDDALDEAARASDRLRNSTDSAGGGLGRLRDGFTTLKGTAAGVLSDMVTRVIDAFVGLGQEALNSADALTKFGSTMEFAGFDPATIESSRDAVQDYAAQTVYDLETVANTTAQLAANGVQDFVGLTEAAGNLNAVAGGNAETFKSVAMALTQTVGAGKLTTENWNQIADAIPGASGKLQEAMRQNGAFIGDFRDAMAEGQITAEEFQQAIMQLGFTDAAVEAASSVSTIEGAVGNLRSTIVDGITGVLTDSGGMEGITGFINGLNAAFVSAGTFISPAVESISASLTSVKETFQNAFSPEQQAAISGFFQTLGGALISVPFGIIQTAVTVLAEGFKLLITAGAAVADFFNGLPDGIIAAGESFDEFKASVGESLTEALNQATEWGSNVLTSMSDAASGAVEAASTFFSELPGKIEDFVTDALDRIVTWGSNIVSQATETGGSFLTALGSQLSSIPGNVAAWIEGAVQSVIVWGTNMVTQAGQKMTEMATTIKDRLLSLPGELLTIGQQIVQGLIDGISQGVSRVATAITNLATTAINTAKSALGINSPSYEFMRLGEYTAEGFAVGLKAGSSYIDDAMDELTADTKGHVESLNAEIEAIEEESARRRAEKEVAAHEKALADKNKSIEDIEAEYAEKIAEKQEKLQSASLKDKEKINKDILELEKDRTEKINKAHEDIAKLEADWAEKQLKAQEDAQKKQLESQIEALEATEKAYEAVYSEMQDALEDFTKEYESQLDGVAQDRDNLAGKLSDFEMFDLHEGEMHLWSIQPMIDQINAYGDAITGLQDRGVNQSLLDNILELDRQEATQFANELLALSDSQFEQYMALWQEKEDASAQVAASIYQGEMDAIEAEYAAKMPEMMATAADEAMNTLAQHIESTGESAVLTAANIADRIIAEIERINAAQRLSAAVTGASTSFGEHLAENVQNASDGALAARNARVVETAGVISMANHTNADREIVLNVNGKEFARATIPDYRAVDDQSPQIKSDAR